MPPTLNIIGYGSVGQAFHRMLKVALRKDPAALGAVNAVHVWAPEIKETSTDGIFTFHHAPAVERETLNAVLDGMALKEGDIVAELATRIDTIVIWAEAKRRGVHFVNTGFDVWADLELTLDGLDDLRKHAAFSAGSGRTSVFSFGCNPGIASHFVRHGLRVATGINDIKEAAKAFGLKSIVFSERDTQWPVRGTAAEATMRAAMTTTLFNTWSPGNFIVETAESKIEYAGVPEGAKEISSAGPAVASWIPTGPNLGFLAPHDETFTIQPWFDAQIPALFVYEAPPPARFYTKGGKAEHSSKATCKLLTPAKYNIDAAGYDILGALMFSSKPGVPPFWSGIEMNVADAAALDPAGDVGPTPFQVTGGLFAALQYVLRFPNAGDCFPEDVPTEHIYSVAFPWAGRVVTRPAPEALEVVALFDPASPGALAEIVAGEPAAARVTVKASPLHGEGTFAAEALAPSTALLQLPVETLHPFDGAGAAAKVNHSADPNAYVDRNRAVRTLRAVAAGEEVTVDYNTFYPAADAAVKFVDSASGKPITNWTALSAKALHFYVRSLPAEAFLLDEIHAYFA